VGCSEGLGVGSGVGSGVGGSVGNGVGSSVGFGVIVGASVLRHSGYGRRYPPVVTPLNMPVVDAPDVSKHSPWEIASACQNMYLMSVALLVSHPVGNPMSWSKDPL
jgi:hypothetical protein